MGSITDGSDPATSYQEFLIRTYNIPAGLAGMTIQSFERSFKDARVFVERVRTAVGVTEPDPLYRLCEGDHVAVSGRESVLIGPTNPLKDHEVSDREVLQVPVTTAVIQITSKDVHGRYMGDIGNHEAARGVFLLEWKRNGQPLPKTKTTEIMIGDHVTITGTKSAIDRASAYFGKPVRASITSDVALIGLTAAISGAIGLLSFDLGGIAIGLGTSVAILLGGIVAGWWTSSHQMVPPVPDAVLWFLDSVGLAGFIAVTALTAGPAFITSIRESGLAILTGAVLTTIFPHMVTLLVGRWIFKVHPGILLGISAGAGTCAPSLAAVQEAAHSSVPTLGYSVSYAIGNILLAFAGISIVLILSR
jgi:putative transport protein